MNKIIAIVVITALILTVSITIRMDNEITKQKEVLKESRQALLVEQQEIQNRITELNKQYERIEDLYIAQGIWINDIRERLHFEFMDELEAEMGRE